MKKILALFALLLAASAVALCALPPENPAEPFQAGAIRISEVDGSPNGNLIRWLKVANTSLSVSGDTATWTGVGSSLAGAEGADATLTLQADESDDSGDDWAISSVASGNALTVANDTSGSQVTKLAISTTGVITFSDSETLTDASDVLTFTFDDAAATINVKAFEATAANFVLQADESDDNGDDWAIVCTTADAINFTNDASGSHVLGFGMAAPAGAFVINGSLNFAADAQGSDTYVITLSPAPTAYTTGMYICYTATTANTGACTINVNGLGAKNLLSLNNVTPPDNYIEAGSVVVAVYDGTSFQMIQPDANP